MISEESDSGSVRQIDDSPPAFSVSGQFMMTSEEKAVHSDDFNPRKIVALTLDDSLARLFECLTLEYSGSILLTPKWKNFRTQKLKFAEKTRINNAIWRSWHIQFQEGQRPLFCQFDNPLTEMAKPPKPVTLMVEGRYWKRKLEVVAAEYQKWRVFYKHMVEDKFQDVELQHQTEEILRLDQEISDKLRERDKARKYVGNHSGNKSFSDTSSPVSRVVSQALEMVDSCNLMESMVFSLPDTLFTSLEDDHQRFLRMSSGTFKDTADTVQPTLDTLQPSLEAMTPVLDELIEQLEASMKGSELNWDFPGLEKNIDSTMGLTQYSAAQHQLETMDHSGRYSGTYRPVEARPTSRLPPSSWPLPVTSAVPSQSMYRTTRLSRHEPDTPVWTSSPGMHPGMIGVQTVGTQMPGLYAQATSATPKSFSATVAPVVDLGGISEASASPITTSRPYVSPALPAKQNAPAPAVRCSTAAASSVSGAIPRNSSDSQLYLLSTLESAPYRARDQSVVPVEVQAPNLVAQLKLAKVRHPLVEEKPKKARIPRNKSAPGLASLEASAQLKKAPQAGGVRPKKFGRIPRNRSDSSLAALLRQSEQTTSRQRRDSESGDLLMTRSPATPLSMATAQDQLSSVYTRHQVGQPRPGIEVMEQDAVAFTSATTSRSLPSYMPAVPSVADSGNSSSQLVNDMVSHLMSKGISMEEIMTRLTTMAGAGTGHPSQLSARQAASLAASVATSFQDPPATRSTLGQATFTSPVPTTSSASLTPSADTRGDTSKITPARNRRKPQTPRPSFKSARTECAAVSTEISTSQSTDDIIQNILSQNRQGFKTSSRGTTVDPSKIRESTTAESLPRWGNHAGMPYLDRSRSVTETPLSRLFNPQHSVEQGAPTQVSYSAAFENASCEGGLHNSLTADQPPHGLRPTAASNSGLTGSVLMTSPPAMTMTVSHASPLSKTKEATQATGSAPSVVGGDNLKGDAETQVRPRPLTKTLPKEQYIEHRRMVHVSAEQKRRGNIKMGFDQLISMVPELASQGSSKISKAAVLRKSVDYILQIQREKEAVEEERQRLKKEIEKLNVEISLCQQQLPETGVMVNKQVCSDPVTDFNEMESLFNRYIQRRTEQNPKFWIFSGIMRPLFSAYSSSVTTANAEEFCRSVLDWLNDSCSLPKLRPSVLASLRELIKQTSVLSDPSKLPEQARLAANALDRRSFTDTRPR